MALKQENRWEARPRTAAALKVLIYALPFIISMGGAAYSQRFLLDRFPDLNRFAAAGFSLPIALVLLALTGRAMRRLLPLAMLLKLSLLFPDQVPGRLGVALRAASTKRLMSRAQESSGDEAVVAENLLTLVAALGSHDRRTRGHSERVRAVTMLLADEIGLEGEKRDKLEWAALLHDLGKLDVPPEILNKNGRPSEDEWAILRQHPAGGPGHAVGLSDWLGEWIHAMDQHHERFDGTGYPLGLRADDIALSGRIVSVSDAFEVMTATRSYKKPMTTQAARDELVSCAGNHFDPSVVRAFMAISIGDIHRALGPTSWLASIPIVGSATHGLGATAGGALLGGSINPALAAAAMLLLSPVIDEPSASQSAPSAIAMVASSEDSTLTANADESSTKLVAAGTFDGRATEALPWRGSGHAGDFDLGVGIDAVASDSEGPSTGETPTDGTGPLPNVTPPPAPVPVIESTVDEIIGASKVLTGTLLGETGPDDLVETATDATAETVDELAGTAATGVSDAVELLGDGSESVRPLVEEDGVVEELIAPAPTLPPPPPVRLPTFP